MNQLPQTKRSYHLQHMLFDMTKLWKILRLAVVLTQSHQNASGLGHFICMQRLGDFVHTRKLQTGEGAPKDLLFQKKCV